MNWITLTTRGRQVDRDRFVVVLVLIVLVECKDNCRGSVISWDRDGRRRCARDTACAVIGGPGDAREANALQGQRFTCRPSSERVPGRLDTKHRDRVMWIGDGHAHHRSTAGDTDGTGRDHVTTGNRC